MAEKVFDRRAIPAGAGFAPWAARDGWPVRAFDWPVADARGSILFLGGRGDIAEKYLESFHHWHQAGWHVSSFDWRGQGGSGRLAANPRVGHIADFGIWVEDLADWWVDWCARAPGPHCIVSHSMGGHLVLRALVERRIDPAAAVLVAPMLGFDTRLMPVPLIAAVVRLAARLSPERLAWKENERPARPGALRQFFLTHDDARYADEIWWKENHPELELGPPSLSWLAQSHASCAGLAAPGVPEGVTTPLFVLSTAGDRLVSPSATTHIAGRLPNAETRHYGSDVAHEILREVDAVRDDALALIDAFFTRRTAA